MIKTSKIKAKAVSSCAYGNDIKNFAFTVVPQFNSHKSVQKLFHNLLIIFSNSLMGFKVTSA